MDSALAEYMPLQLQHHGSSVLALRQSGALKMSLKPELAALRMGALEAKVSMLGLGCSHLLHKHCGHLGVHGVEDDGGNHDGEEAQHPLHLLDLCDGEQPLLTLPRLLRAPPGGCLVQAPAAAAPVDTAPWAILLPKIAQSTGQDPRGSGVFWLLL